MSQSWRAPVAPVALSQVCALIGQPPVAGEVTGVTLASGSVIPGDLYAGLPGARTHGARFADQAVTAGAAAVLTDPAGAALAGHLPVPVLVCEDPRAVLGAVSAEVFGHPAQALTTYGITGTNGKTTVTYMLAAALTSLGIPTGLIGTTGTWLGQRQVPTTRTTPEAPDVHALMRLMVDEGMQALAMEVSSHALVLGRVDALLFDVAAFTNLSPDHLDFHADMEDYFAAKATLFTPDRCRAAVINTDDQWGRRLAAAVPGVTYAVSGTADWSARDLVSDATGSAFTATGPDVEVRMRVSSPGEFNVANALAALVMLVTAGHDPHAVAGAMTDFHGVPGRMEVVHTDNPDEPAVIVDYAHTPDAVQRALQAVRPLTQGRIWCVVGAGGDRDSGKRAVMGAMAASHADVVIVTDDNPRSESAADIRAAVIRGAREQGAPDLREIGDRAEAIATAVTAASPQDTVMLLGKGHETGQEVAGVVHPFDDREVARDALEARK